MTFSIEYKTVPGEYLVLVAGRRRYPMDWNPGNVWTVEPPRCTQSMLDSYSYELMRDGRTLRREWMAHHAVLRKDMDCIRDSWIIAPADANPFIRRHNFRKFDKKGWRGAGTSVSLCTLRGEKGFGIGEFEDLKLLALWAEQTGQSVIHLQPVGDADPFFALHPQYLRLTDMGIAEDAAYKKIRSELNALPVVDFETVNKAKSALTRAHFAAAGRADLDSTEYLSFYEENKKWLLPHAVHIAMREERQGGGACVKLSAKKLREYCLAHKDEVDYHLYIQYHLDRQLKSAVDFAHKKGVCFKCDVPGGTVPAGADALDWWKACLCRMAEYFDLFSIDCLPAASQRWDLTEFVSCTGMLACCDDPGAIPARTPELLDELKILTLRTLPVREAQNQDPVDPSGCPYMSISTLSTQHRRPFSAPAQESKRLAASLLASPSMLAVLPLQDWMAVDEELRPDSKENPAVGNVNIAGDRAYDWNSRMHLCLENFVYSQESNRRLREMIAESGR